MLIYALLSASTLIYIILLVEISPILIFVAWVAHTLSKFLPSLINRDYSIGVRYLEAFATHSDHFEPHRIEWCTQNADFIGRVMTVTTEHDMYWDYNLAREYRSPNLNVSFQLEKIDIYNVKHDSHIEESSLYLCNESACCLLSNIFQTSCNAYKLFIVLCTTSSWVFICTISYMPILTWKITITLLALKLTPYIVCFYLFIQETSYAMTYWFSRSYRERAVYYVPIRFRRGVVKASRTTTTPESYTVAYVPVITNFPRIHIAKTLLVNAYYVWRRIFMKKPTW